MNIFESIQIIEAEQAPDEREFAAVSTRVTLAHLAVEEANENYNRCKFDNPIPTSDVIEQLARLRRQVELTERALQDLLGPYSEAKSKVNGWR